MLLKCQSAWCSTEKSLKSICKIMASKFGMSDTTVCIFSVCTVLYVCILYVERNFIKHLVCHSAFIPTDSLFLFNFFFPLKIIYCMCVSVCLSKSVGVSLNVHVCVYACCLGAGVWVFVCVASGQEGVTLFPNQSQLNPIVSVGFPNSIKNPVGTRQRHIERRREEQQQETSLQPRRARPRAST